jgi:periplasmic protein TonB
MISAFMFTVLLAQVTASPMPTPTTACNHDAEVVRPDYPRDFANPFWQNGEVTTLYATVSVLVGPDGQVEKASIYKSSGYLQFDMASIRAAKSSSYKPKLVDCKPVEGTVLFKTLFAPGTPPP